MKKKPQTKDFKARLCAIAAEGIRPPPIPLDELHAVRERVRVLADELDAAIIATEKRIKGESTRAR